MGGIRQVYTSLLKSFIAYVLVLSLAGCKNFSSQQVTYLPCEKFEADLALTFSCHLQDSPFKFTSQFYYKRILGGVAANDTSISFTRSVSDDSLPSGYFFQISNMASQKNFAPMLVNASYTDLMAKHQFSRALRQSIELPLGKSIRAKSGYVLYEAKWERIWNRDLDFNR